MASANLGPEPLAAPIPRARVGEHRSLFCRSYDACLDRAAIAGWASWTCSRCARFHPPCTRGPRAATAPSPVACSPAPSPSARSGIRPAAAPRAPRAQPRPPERVRSPELADGDLHVPPDAPSVPALFIQAAREVAGVVRGRPLEPQAEWAEEVSIAAADLDGLLHEWIRELALRSVRSSVRFTEFDIVYLSERRLVASIRGRRVGAARGPADAAGRDPSRAVRRDGVGPEPALDG